MTSFNSKRNHLRSLPPTLHFISTHDRIMINGLSTTFRLLSRGVPANLLFRDLGPSIRNIFNRKLRPLADLISSQLSTSVLKYRHEIYSIRPLPLSTGSGKYVFRLTSHGIRNNPFNALNYLYHHLAKIHETTHCFVRLDGFNSFLFQTGFPPIPADATTLHLRTCLSVLLKFIGLVPSHPAYCSLIFFSVSNATGCL